VERLLEVSQLRYRAEEAGITSVAMEEGSLVLRFSDDWSRADTMRALAPTSPSDPLRALAGGLRYGSNQLRIRPPREPELAWQLTRQLVDRLTTATRGSETPVA
jgi:hypothetical protein